MERCLVALCPRLAGTDFTVIEVTRTSGLSARILTAGVHLEPDEVRLLEQTLGETVQVRTRLPRTNTTKPRRNDEDESLPDLRPDVQDPKAVAEVPRLLGETRGCTSSLNRSSGGGPRTTPQTPAPPGRGGLYSGASPRALCLTGEQIARGPTSPPNIARNTVEGDPRLRIPRDTGGLKPRPQDRGLTTRPISAVTVSNELLHEEAHRFFHWCASDRRRASDMLLVVTKMNRETGERGDLEQHLQRMVDPFPLARFRPTFIDSLDYLEAQRENDEELIQHSGFEEFLHTLDRTVEEQGKDSRLRATVRRCLESLEAAHSALEAWRTQEAGDLAAVEQSLRSVRACRAEIGRRVNEEYRLFRSKARELADELCAEVSPENQEKFEAAAADCQTRLQAEAEELAQAVGRILAEETERLRQTLATDSLGPTEFAWQSTPGGPTYEGTGPQSFDGKKAKAASNATTRLGQYLSGLGKDQVYAAAKWAGIKFKPWGATKLTGFVNTSGRFLGGAAVVLGAYVQYKEEQDEARWDEEIRKIRKEIREGYREAADTLQAQVDQILKDWELENLSPVEEDMQGTLTAAQEQARRTGDLDQRIQTATKTTEQLYTSAVTAK